MSADSHNAVSVPSLIAPASDETFVGFLELSQSVPVVVAVGAETSLEAREVTSALEKLITEREGDIVLVTVDAASCPEVVSALQVRVIPTVAALINGQLAPLFEGVQAETTIREILAKVRAAAEQNGVVGRAQVAGDGETESEAEEPLSPLHQEAFDAIERADYPAAIDAYNRALAENPADVMAQAGLAQVRLINRLRGKTLADIRATAANNPDNMAAALDVADLDLSGGHVEDACGRLLTLFVSADDDSKRELRERLLEYFLIVGDTDPRVISARTQLANLLF